VLGIGSGQRSGDGIIAVLDGTTATGTAIVTDGPKIGSRTKATSQTPTTATTQPKTKATAQDQTEASKQARTTSTIK
jgi:hypothetical protein